MKLYIFSIQFLNEKDSLEYNVIKGVYDCKETAKEEAKKALNAQKALWPDSYAVKIGEGDTFVKVALKCKDGVSKIYLIQEVPLNTAI